MKLSSQRKTAYLYLIINAILWGASPPIVKFAFNEGLDAFRFLFYRYLFAAILAIPILIYYWPKINRKITKIRKIILLEILGITVSLSLLYYGLSKTSSIEASLISTTTPILVTMGGIWFFREREEKHELTGMFLAVIGTILLVVIPVFVESETKFAFSLEGNLLVLGQCITTAAYLIIAKNLYKKLPHFFVTSVSFYVGLISFFLISWIDAGSLSSLFEFMSTDFSHPSYLFASIYMAFFGSIIAVSLLIKGQTLIEISESSLFTYLQPLIAIPISILWLGERVIPFQFIALAMVATGVFIASRRGKTSVK
ncbi:DMT family transporter [Candidatus Dojkabacteria bacterium]|nr:DMT family transporter [Candidatus Dojkabacteria bacterium]